MYQHFDHSIFHTRECPPGLLPEPGGSLVIEKIYRMETYLKNNLHPWQGSQDRKFFKGFSRYGSLETIEEPPPILSGRIQVEHSQPTLNYQGG